jgi:uncharacterized protein (DUF4415 family)
MSAHDPLKALARRRSLTDDAGEVRELTTGDLQHFRPSGEVLPSSLRRKVGLRGPQKAPTKIALSLRLSPQVVDAFRATGDGWQTRINAALLQWLKRHKPEDVAGAKACRKQKT